MDLEGSILVKKNFLRLIKMTIGLESVPIQESCCGYHFVFSRFPFARGKELLLTALKSDNVLQLTLVLQSCPISDAN